MIKFLKNLFRTPPPVRSGVVDAPLRDTDYIASGNSPVVYKERVKDWTLWMWSKVLQWCQKADNLGCTGNALATALETQWYFLTGEKRQISRRWINKMSGCNQGALKGIGNYLIAPVDWVRKNGWVWEEDYPTPYIWSNDEYYADIPEPRNSELLALAKENKKLLKPKGVNGDDCLEYEYLSITDPNIDYHLKHAPILATIPGHQTCAFTSPGQLTTYRDSYEPWDKNYPSKDFLRLLKVVIELNKIEAFIFGFKGSPEKWVGFPMDSMQTLDKVKAKDPHWQDNYIVVDRIVELPIKKP